MAAYSEVQKCKKIVLVTKTAKRHMTRKSALVANFGQTPISETIRDRAKWSEIWDHLVDDFLQRSSKMSKNSPDDENGEMSHDPKICTFRKFGPNTYLGNR